MNITTVAVPNLIAFDIVIVKPMQSFYGYINYLKFTYGSNKGKTTAGTVINDPFRLGNVDVNYTASTVNESTTATTADATANKIALKWTPVAELKGVKVAGVAKTIVAADAVLAAGQCKLVDGFVEFYAGELTATNVVDTLYVYDNVVIPQNDLPILNAEMDTIQLQAKARRIAIYYSQMAQFQAKTDYGFDLGDQLAEKAVGELNYEIDTEITDLLAANAAQDGDLVWSKTLPVGVSKQEHYGAFSEIISMAAQKIYDRTRRYSPNYMLIASNILPILEFVPGFSAAPRGTVNGPYFAGTINGLKVFVTPNIEAGKFVIGVNGDDLQASAAVYAPYMPVVPTQLLGYADGGMSQGYSTLYDLKLLNKDLLVSGRVTA